MLYYYVCISVLLILENLTRYINGLYLNTTQVDFNKTQLTYGFNEV